MTVLTHEQFSNLADAAEEAGATVYAGYSGRFMFGEKCVGVVGSLTQLTKTMVFLDRVEARLAGDMADVMCTDDMGLDKIYYFPGYTTPEER